LTVAYKQATTTTARILLVLDGSHIALPLQLNYSNAEVSWSCFFSICL